MSAHILVVDDEVGMQVALREVLQRKGHRITVASDAPAALEALEGEGYDLVISDVRMPDMSGLELLDRVQVKWPQTPMLIMTAYGTIEDAVEAMKKGAADYLLKPFSSETLEEIVERHLASDPRPADPETTDDAQADAEPGRPGFEPISASPASQQVLALCREIADSTATVLVQGESGTGKEVVARYIHMLSSRRDHPFVAVNCAALPEGLLESELFGHEKGAFTGAVLARKGKFELANKGTLLLDEISEMPLSLQAKLLRVLQERQIDPIGSQRPVNLDVRVVATTNRNLAQFVEEGNFREDLFYRLQVIHMEIPPLRARIEDILPLSEYFVRRHCRTNRRPKKRIGQAMRRYLTEQPWRGNVRELENFLERAVLLCKDEEITPDNIHLGPRPSAPLPLGSAPFVSRISAPSVDKAEGTPRMSGAAPGSREASPGILTAGEVVTLEEMERRLILQTLEKTGGNRTRTADLLGVSVRTIRNKLNQYGVGASAQAEAGS